MKAKSIATSNPGPAASQQPSRMSSVPGNARHGGAGNANTVGRRPQSAGNSGQPRAASVGDVSRNPAISPHRVGGATQAAPRGSGTAQQPRGAGQAAQGKQSPRGSYAPVRNGNEGQAKSAISRALSQTGAPWLFDAISREKAETLLSPFKNTYVACLSCRRGSHSPRVSSVTLLRPHPIHANVYIDVPASPQVQWCVSCAKERSVQGHVRI